MEQLGTYILQVNLLLIIVYLGYIGLLKNLTFYQLNRTYFLVGVTYSFVYPFLDFQVLFQRHAEPVGELLMDWTVLLAGKEKLVHAITLAEVLLVFVAVGVVFLLGRLIVQMMSLRRIHINSEPATWQSYLYRNVLFPIAPFSFFNKIYLNIRQHKEHELHEIFHHEDIHVKGMHTLDILFLEVVLILCWYNPVVWLMRKAVRQNLEFLTDQHVLNKGVDKQVYQYSLLNVNKQGEYSSITNQFNFKMLRRRIMMMNKKRSSKLELSKYAFLLPVLILTAGTLTAYQVDDRIEQIVVRANEMVVDVDLPVGKGVQKTIQDTVPKKEVTIARDSVTGEYVGIRVRTNGKIDTISSPVIALRGVATMEGKKPLVILDGNPMPSNKLSDISPDNIDNISILKDKSATALYGDKGKDGVILITTKKATRQKKNNKEIVVEGYPATKKDTTNVKEADNKEIFVKGYASNAKKDTLKFTKTKAADYLLNRDIEIIVDGEKKEKGFDLNSIDPNTIEFMEVVKEAGAPDNTGTIHISTKKNVRLQKMMDPITVVGHSGQKSNDTKSEVPPEPVEGTMKFRKWIGENYQFPKEAIDAGAKGTVIVSFIVEKDGSLSNIKAIQDIGYGTGKVAEQLLARAKKWKPGLEDGKPVRVKYSIPIHLDLSK